MKAVVWRGNGLIELEDRTLGTLGEEEALVRVSAAGICATDLHILQGRLVLAPPPMVFGHEVAGVVEETGRRVPAEWVGRRAVLDPVVGCGTCLNCRSGRKLFCRSGGELGTTRGDGGYAEYIVVPALNLYELPDKVSFEEGALLEPLNCALGAFLRAAPRPGQSVLIFGSGPAGLLFLQLARASGCTPILLVGGGHVRLALGARLGASGIWDHRHEGLKEEILRATQGEGPDLVVEASGTSVAVSQAFQWVRRGGCIILYGVSGIVKANIASDLIVTKDLSVFTGIGSPLRWAETIKLAAVGHVNLGCLVTHRFPLEAIAEAVSHAQDEDHSIKVVLHPASS